MLSIILGLAAGQTTRAPLPAAPPAPPAPTANCRAPDGRFILHCFPKGTVVKMDGKHAEPKAKPANKRHAVSLEPM